MVCINVVALTYQFTFKMTSDVHYGTANNVFFSCLLLYWNLSRYDIAGAHNDVDHQRHYGLLDIVKVPFYYCNKNADSWAWPRRGCNEYWWRAVTMRNLVNYKGLGYYIDPHGSTTWCSTVKTCWCIF